MALPDRTKLTIGTPIILGLAADHTGGVTAINSFGTITDEIDCTDLLQLLAEQSVKFDFTASFDVEYVLGAAIEFAAVPTEGETVDFYIGYSNNSALTEANPGNLTGSIGGYTGQAGSTLAETLPQLNFLGSMVLTADATTVVQKATSIATFTPRMRYGMLVVVNQCASADFHSDMNETSFILQPLEQQLQE